MQIIFIIFKLYFTVNGCYLQEDNTNIKIKLTKVQTALLNKYVKEKNLTGREKTLNKSVIK